MTRTYKISLADIRNDAETTGERWWVFTAYNSQAHYGFGTEAEADAYSDILNRKREINVYGYEAVEDEDALLNLSNGYDTDGFRLDDAIANQADLDAWQAEEAGSR